MYLNYLEEKEKIAFLKLAHYVAHSDGDFCHNEKVIVGSYCNEMGIVDFEVNLTEDIKSICSEFKNTKSKRVVILELMSIINANGEFKESEKLIIDQLVTNFEISEDYLENVQNWSNALLDIVDQGFELIEI
ncbi:MAG: hypothetical protein ACERKK_07845 [Poseidonibacter sp.]|uniref:tellurite resistance TerB family protein n=1 Tax=Poseidonibacter sp. TaxID=2321188 RepID=UPI00359E8432